MDFASLWWAAQKSAGDAYKVIIRASNNGTSINENILISDLFTVEQWTEDKPKIVEIQAGAIVGGTGGNIAMRTGTGRVGTLTIDNYGSIEGQGGAANGGSGYVALQANQASILNNYNTGFIGGGGGGGGQGGQGGKGGNGSVTSTIDTGPGYGVTPANPASPNKADCDRTCLYQGPSDVCKGGFGSAYCNWMVSPKDKINCFTCTRTSTTTTYGTNGGAGGSGGVGQGYNQSPAGTGANGVAGANPPTNAGRGGTGGKGGDGGAWASAGSQGGSGTTGANGTVTNGSAGSAGSAGGSGAISIENAQLLTITNDGTIAGEFQYTATIFSANNDTATNEDVNVVNLFTSGQWSSSLPKIVTIETGAIVGATSTSNNALTIPNSGGGIVSIINNGEIQGAGGSANGGAGGRAVLVQKANTVMLIADGAAVRGGGGGGGKGGTGGTGGGGKYTTNKTLGRAPTANNGTCPFSGYEDMDGWNCYDYSSSTFAMLTCRKYYPSVGNAECSSYSEEGGFSCCLKCNSCYQPGGTTVNTNGGAGGAGGNGGVGQGYKQSATNGSGGAAGSNGGTNAGKGGTGGTGGNGASWGNAGGKGNTGATGANGNRTNGSAGSGGSNGGSAGISIAGTSLLTLTNNGTLLGNTTA